MLKKRVGQFLAGLALLVVLASVSSVTIDLSTYVDEQAIAVESTGSGGGC